MKPPKCDRGCGRVAVWMYEAVAGLSLFLCAIHARDRQGHEGRWLEVQRR